MYQKLKECKSIKEIYEVIPEEFYEKCAVVLIFFMNMVIVVESLTKIIYNKGSYWNVMQNYNLLGIIKRTTAVSSSVKVGKPCVVANRRTVVAKEYREIARKVMNVMEG